MVTTIATIRHPNDDCLSFEQFDVSHPFYPNHYAVFYDQTIEFTLVIKRMIRNREIFDERAAACRAYEQRAIASDKGLACSNVYDHRVRLDFNQTDIEHVMSEVA